MLVDRTGGETLSDPVWSPDGTTLAHVRTDEGADLRTEAACRLRAFSGLTGRGFRFVRRRGALVALSEDSAVVMSGHATTTVYDASGPRLGRVLRRLRAVDAKRPHRLEPPRIPRRLEARSASPGARRLREALGEQ